MFYIFYVYYSFINTYFEGIYLGSNQEPTKPQLVVLPIELYLPYNYPTVIRTPTVNTKNL